MKNRDAHRLKFQAVPVSCTMELSGRPQTIESVLLSLFDHRYDGQILIDFRRGRPRVVSFPGLQHLPLT